MPSRFPKGEESNCRRPQLTFFHVYPPVRKIHSNRNTLSRSKEACLIRFLFVTSVRYLTKWWCHCPLPHVMLSTPPPILGWQLACIHPSHILFCFQIPFSLICVVYLIHGWTEPKSMNLGLRVLLKV
jgi:hypothetical protein